MNVRSLLLLLVLGGTAAAQALPPEEALKRMKVADGFKVSLVACEPDVRQPLTISFTSKPSAGLRRLTVSSGGRPAATTPVDVRNRARSGAANFG